MKKRLLILFVILSVLSGFSPIVSHAAKTEREIFSDGLLRNVDISVSSPSLCKTDYLKSDEEHLLGKKLQVGINGYGYYAVLHFANFETLDLSDRENYSLVLKLRDVNSAKKGLIRPALYMPSKSNPDIYVAAAVPGFLNTDDYPKYSEASPKENLDNSWSYINIPVSSFEEKGRFYDKTKSLGEQDPTCGKDESFRMLEGDYTKVCGIVFLCNAWTMNGSLGSHYYSFAADDVRIINSTNNQIEPFLPEFYDSLGDKITDLTNVPEKPVVKLKFSSELMPGQLNANTVSVSNNTEFTVEHENGETYLSFPNALEYGTEYTITIKKGITDIAGNMLTSDCEVTFTTREKPAISLTAPKGLTVTETGYTSVGLEWEAVESADIYYIYRGEKKIAETAETKYTDSGLETGEKYEYSVCAINTRHKVVSQKSAAVTAVTKILSAPTGFFAAEKGSTIVLAWNDDGANTDGFHLYRNGELLCEQLIRDFYYRDETTEIGVEYTYELTAVSNGAESQKTTVTAMLQSSETDVVLFANGKYQAAAGGGWNGAEFQISSEKGVRGESNALKATVPAYSGAELRILSPMNLSDRAVREKTFLSFWIKANANGSATGKVRLSCLDASKNESPIQINVDSEKWQYYSVPISSFSDYGMKYEGSEYKKKTMNWNSLQYIGFYANASNVEFILDEVRIDSGISKIERSEFYDKEEKYIPARESNVPVNAQYVKLYLTHPSDMQSIPKINVKDMQGIVKTEQNLLQNGLTIQIKLPHLSYGTNYQITLPEGFSAAEAYGSIKSDSIPDEALTEKEFISKLRGMCFDDETKLSGIISDKEQTTDFCTEQLPVSVTDMQIKTENGKIIVDADFENTGNGKRNITAIMLLYQNDNGVLHCLGLNRQEIPLLSGEKVQKSLEMNALEEANCLSFMIYDNLKQLSLYYNKQENL